MTSSITPESAPKAAGKAYQPLLLFKCLMLQKWFQIPSDPELESQINDRISFKSFLGLPMDQPAPDHSTFSRFRSRLSKKAVVQLDSALLPQLHQHGVTINEGIAVDARLIRSGSKSVSKEKLNELHDKQNSAAGAIWTKNGEPKKFSRDHELATLFDDRSRARFTTIVKNSIDALLSICLQLAQRGRNLKAPSRIAGAQLRLEPQIQANTAPGRGQYGAVYHRPPLAEIVLQTAEWSAAS